MTTTSCCGWDRPPAVALTVKLLIAALWIAAGVAILVFGPRDLLRRPPLCIGAGIAALSLVPTLWWQAANGWPQLEMGDVIAHETTGAWSGRAGFLPALLTGAGGLPAVYRPSRGFWYFGHPPETAGNVLFVGPDPARLLDSFTDTRIVSRPDNAPRRPQREADAWPGLREFRI